MKIGIATLQNSLNIGAYLQAYAMEKFLEGMGHKVSFLKINNYSLAKNKLINDILAKKPKKLIFKVDRYLKFIKAQYLLPTSNSKEKFDVVLIGSDSIWDLTEPTMGYIPQFFGNELNSSKIITYAPSFGTLNKLSDLNDDSIKGLKKIDHICARDTNTAKLIAEITGKESEIVLDPTWLFDFSGLEKTCKEEKFILIYGGFLDDWVNEIKKFSESVNLKLISVGSYNPWCDKSIAADPFEFLGYLKEAEYVITSMYHGSIFAAKYNKQFASYFTAKRMTKAKTMFENLELSDRLVDKDNLLANIFKNEVNYVKVNQATKNNIDLSIKYLNKALEPKSK